MTSIPKPVIMYARYNVQLSRGCPTGEACSQADFSLTLTNHSGACATTAITTGNHNSSLDGGGLSMTSSFTLTFFFYFLFFRTTPRLLLFFKMDFRYDYSTHLSRQWSVTAVELGLLKKTSISRTATAATLLFARNA